MKLTENEKEYLYYLIEEKIIEFEDEFDEEDEMESYDKEQFKMVKNIFKKLKKDLIK